MATILLIDDSEALLEMIQRMLILAGHKVVAKNSGDAALRYLAHANVDLLLTDLHMPPPDGFEVIAAVRALARPVPVIVMSTDPLGCSVLRAARALGATDALHKPFTREKLLAGVDNALKHPTRCNAPHADRAAVEQSSRSTSL